MECSGIRSPVWMLVAYVRREGEFSIGRRLILSSVLAEKVARSEGSESSQSHRNGMFSRRVFVRKRWRIVEVRSYA